MLSVQDALVKYKYAEVSNQQLAEFMGFSQEEQKMLTMFWEPTFNKGWIYLSDEIILSQMTNAIGKDALKDFYRNNLLIDDYEEDIDYKKIKKDDELVKKFYSENPPNRKTSNRKKYYAVTGDTYKDLLQKSANKKGKTTRRYYRKIEQLAIFMKDYISALHKHILEEKLKEKDNQINRIHNVNIELLSYKKLTERNETIYIVSTRGYANQGIFKIGKTKNNMKLRSSAHNVTHVTGDKVKVLKEFKVNNAASVEKNIHSKLNGLLLKGEKEFFMCPYNMLEELVELTVFDDNEQNNLVNTIIDTVNMLKCTEHKPENWTVGIEPSIFAEPENAITLVETKSNEETRRTVVDVANLTESEKKEKLIKAVTTFIKDKNIKQDFDYEADKNNELHAQLVWKDIITYLMAICNTTRKNLKINSWKPEMKNIYSASPCIGKIKWR